MEGGLRWVRNVAHVGEENRCIQAFVEDRGSERNHLEYLGVGQKTVLNWIFQK